MANQIRAPQVFRYRNFHINKSQPLGHGSYGAVYKAKCDQLSCAAKLLHPTILDPSDPGAGKIMERFRQECSFLGNIRHPNIVQYLGVTRDPESRLPVLLMELLDESLTKMLEHSQHSLAYYVQVDLCHDIASAVAYLHSNDIIHRDLSSNNVLIMAKSRAKVTDFGMSKLAGAAPRMTPLTMCPGTLAYMPPETLNEPPIYTKKLDCFSEGVIMIQVCTRLWPEPGPCTKTVPFPASPTGVTLMPVPESERRKNHIDMIDCDHGLLPIAMDCLHYQENERPSSEELCQRLVCLKETREYRESVEQVERVQNDIDELERQVREMKVRETAIVQQLCDEIQKLHSEILSKNLQLRQKESQLQSKDAQIKKQEQVTAEIQQTNNSLQRQVEQLQQQLSQQNAKPSPPPSQVQVTSHAHARGKQLQQDHSVKEKQKPHLSTRHTKLGEWSDRERAPYNMSWGAAVVDGNVAYFIHHDHPCQVCSYNSSIKRWSKLPQCPCKYSSLTVIRGLLTAIGGDSGSGPDNKLLSIVNEDDKKWVEHFPHMPTKRVLTTAVTTEQHLIVAGGKGVSNRLNTVEVMDIQTLVWSTAASLRYPYSKSSAAICGDHIYMLGGQTNDGRSKSALTCSLTKLLQSCSDTLHNSVWHRIANVPVYCSTCAAVNGELVAVGGEDANEICTAAVHKYNPTTNSWDIISNMPTARRHCLVTVLPTNEMMVVGGFTNKWYSSLTDKVETVYNIV